MVTDFGFDVECCNEIGIDCDGGRVVMTNGLQE